MSDRVPEPELRTVKMSDRMADAAVQYAKAAFEKYSIERDIAQYIKQKFDQKFGVKWHCVVGRHFASHVSYEPEHYIYMKVGEEVVLLFKSGGEVPSTTSKGRN